MAISWALTSMLAVIGGAGSLSFALVVWGRLMAAVSAMPARQACPGFVVPFCLRDIVLVLIWMKPYENDGAKAGGRQEGLGRKSTDPQIFAAIPT